ncbi:D12 class N6 adenine-specific DNA methyltransferase, partial [Treponema phagedenis F0421]
MSLETVRLVGSTTPFLKDKVNFQHFNRIEEIENKAFLEEQIITYIGNKRRLLDKIAIEVDTIGQKLNKKKMVCVDLFSGSGIVARLLKQYSSVLYANDLEAYCKVINECYLSNVGDFPQKEYTRYFNEINKTLSNLKTDGIIYTNYAPKDDTHIKHGERCFYTAKNAQIIDTIRTAIDSVPIHLQKFFLAPLLYSASVHVNTGGVFKGFYKDMKTGVGKFGGTAENALKRIKKEITLLKPILSNFSCEVHILQDDANIVAKNIHGADIVYI